MIGMIDRIDRGVNGGPQYGPPARLKVPQSNGHGENRRPLPRNFVQTIARRDVFVWSLMKAEQREKRNNTKSSGHTGISSDLAY